MMEAVRTSETSVDNNFTRQYIPENNSEHHTRRRENLKSHMLILSQNTKETLCKTVSHLNNFMSSKIKVKREMILLTIIKAD
jgi:hypothetical protein